MKNFIKYIFLAIFLLQLAGCSWYVRYPSVGVGVKVKTRTETRIICHWKYVKPNVRIKQCKKVRVRIR